MICPSEKKKVLVFLQCESSRWPFVKEKVSFRRNCFRNSEPGYLFLDIYSTKTDVIQFSNDKINTELHFKSGCPVTISGFLNDGPVDGENTTDKQMEPRFLSSSMYNSTDDWLLFVHCSLLIKSVNVLS